MIRATFALALTTVVTLGAHAAPAARAVDYGKSRITVITRQLNVPLEGEFRRFNAQVLWMPVRRRPARPNSIST